jgi:uncharacterized LabA/DUF88 family protein
MKEDLQEEGLKKIAILIDGDNAQPSLLGKILAEAGKQGPITIRRIYGDWTTSNMNGWKDVLNNYAIQPIQQFRYTVGKNATDSAMIIDAMDILHSGKADGFCIVSSDSDYTRLATRIRESGIFVMGIGRNKTSKAFVNACNLFIYTENLMPHDPHANKIPSGKKKKSDQKESSKPDPLPLLNEAFELAESEGGWAHLASIGLHLRQLDPGFDPRTFGFKQLSHLIKANSKMFEMRYEDDKGPSAVFVKKKASPALK